MTPTKYRKQADLMKPGERDVKLLESAQHYIENLKAGKMTWRDYYREVVDNVTIKQSHST